MSTMLEDIMTEQALADATSELEQEKVERALAWDRARARVREAYARAKWCRYTHFSDEKHYAAGAIDELLAALDELERLEGGL